MAFAGGRGGFGSRGGRGGFGGYNDGPPDEVVEIGTFVHAVEGEMLCASTQPTKVSSAACGRARARSAAQLLTHSFPVAQVPYFNAPIYLPTKASIGKVDEILGPISEPTPIPAIPSRR